MSHFSTVFMRVNLDPLQLCPFHQTYTESLQHAWIWPHTFTKCNKRDAFSICLTPPYLPTKASVILIAIVDKLSLPIMLS